MKTMEQLKDLVLDKLQILSKEECFELSRMEWDGEFLRWKSFDEIKELDEIISLVQCLEVEGLKIEESCFGFITSGGQTVSLSIDDLFDRIQEK